MLGRLRSRLPPYWDSQRGCLLLHWSVRLTVTRKRKTELCCTGRQKFSQNLSALQAKSPGKGLSATVLLQTGPETRSNLALSQNSSPLVGTSWCTPEESRPPTCRPGCPQDC
ncbi:macrophage mannose receptor 1 [Biomphalaria pfeifferi]|uniref:Macrophage mannose receptor 1 n=1 Tax=Biomphalaria pfeifferi TaxID=112525 RepID=A0AAD8EWS0_BIOPF|nr:macrophage mannose receptor 1 [Biomphalaria pfeifferi]